MASKLFHSLLGAAGLDVDAQAFITAAGITDATQKTAINNLVLGLKADSLWAKCFVIYPFVGGTATTHKYNLKDPRDLDAAYRATFTVTSNATFTHNANGVTPTPNAGFPYIDTHLNGSTVLDKVNSSYSYYSRTDVANVGSDYGGSAACDVYSKHVTGDAYQDMPSLNERIHVAVADSLGLYSGSCNAGSVKFYKRAVEIVSGAAATTNYANTNMVFCNGTASYQQPSNRNLAFAHIGTAMTGTDMTNLYALVQAFQTALGRNV